MESNQSNNPESNKPSNSGASGTTNAAQDAFPVQSGRTPQQKFRAAMIWSLVGLGIVAVIMLVLWTLVLGMAGFVAAVIGVAFGGGFVLITLISFVATMKKPANLMAAVVLGSWLLKMLIAIIVCAALRHASFLNGKAFAITVICALLVTIPAEVKATL
ncbi:MAG: hypothetical protein Q3962_04905 [Corynebacterium sp.]|nr:hypothetical protein [Corynebacterium sp.]